MKILITGANGFLASRIRDYYKERHGIYGLTHADVDFTDAAELQKVFARINPEIVIHCGAISDITTCKKNPDASWYSNVYGTGTVADACNQVDAKLIFCSSDQVYGYRSPEQAHKENEDLNPLNIYGEQKLSAERLATGRNLDTVCLRLSWMYDTKQRTGEHGNLITQLVDRLEAGQPFRYATNEYRSITNVSDIVKATERVCQLPAGIYNIGSSNTLSTYDVVKRFLLPYDKASKLLLPDDESFAGGRNLRMDTSNIEQYGIRMHDTLTSLESIRPEFEELCRQKNIEL